MKKCIVFLSILCLLLCAVPVCSGAFAAAAETMAPAETEASSLSGSGEADTGEPASAETETPAPDAEETLTEAPASEPEEPATEPAAPEPAEEEKPTYGDADQDGRITVEDARTALRVALDLEKRVFPLEILDVDGDGRVTVEDARFILRRGLELDPFFLAEGPYPPPQRSKKLSVKISAPHALLYSVEADRLLFWKNIDERIAPSSLIKLLTAITALKYCKPGQRCRVGKEIGMIGPDSSECPLEIGWRPTLQDLLYGMLLPSGNDAAYCVAANVARKLSPGLNTKAAVAYFVDLMNETAKELGMLQTSVKTPDGYDAEGQYTTVRDLLALARAALENRLILKICGTPEYTCSPKWNTRVTWYSTNRFLREDDIFYDTRVFGLKGGMTDDAGCCLIAAFHGTQNTYITIVTGLDSFTERYVCSAALVSAAEPPPAGEPLTKNE